MTSFAVHEASTGALVSVGSVVADPLPDGLVAVALSQVDADGLQSGARTWDAATRAVVATPGYVDPAIGEANRTAIEQGILDALSRLDTLIAAPDVDTVPAGTLTTAQLSNAVRAMRTAVQQNRDGAQEVAQVLKRTIRLVRGDFDGID